MNTLIALVLITGSALSGASTPHTDAEIYTWIKNKMEIVEDYEMPTVKHVPQAAIASMWS